MELNYTSNTKLLLREQRHDYLNIFQIIYGHLQLNNIDMAIIHMKKAINLSYNSSKCFYISIFSISLLLEQKMKVCENKGIEMVLEVDSSIDSDIRHIDNEDIIVDFISKLFDVFIESTYKKDKATKLDIDIYEDVDRIEFIFNGDIDKKILEDRSREIKDVIKVDDGYEAIFYFNKAKDLLKESTRSTISNCY
ncbi:MAG: Spo0B domain-containing protein [Tissierellales bacterium]